MLVRGCCFFFGGSDFHCWTNNPPVCLQCRTISLWRRDKREHYTSLIPLRVKLSYFHLPSVIVYCGAYREKTASKMTNVTYAMSRDRLGYETLPRLCDRRDDTEKERGCEETATSWSEVKTIRPSHNPKAGTTRARVREGVPDKECRMCWSKRETDIDGSCWWQQMKTDKEILQLFDCGVDITHWYMDTYVSRSTKYQ